MIELASRKLLPGEPRQIPPHREHLQRRGPALACDGDEQERGDGRGEVQCDRRPEFLGCRSLGSGDGIDSRALEQWHQIVVPGLRIRQPGRGGQDGLPSPLGRHDLEGIGVGACLDMGDARGDWQLRMPPPRAGEHVRQDIDRSCLKPRSPERSRQLRVPSPRAGDHVGQDIEVPCLRVRRPEQGRLDSFPSPVECHDLVREDLDGSGLRPRCPERPRQLRVPAPRAGKDARQCVGVRGQLDRQPEGGRQGLLPSPEPVWVAGERQDLDPQVVDSRPPGVAAGRHGQGAAQGGVRRAHELPRGRLLIDCRVQAGRHRLYVVGL